MTLMEDTQARNEEILEAYIETPTATNLMQFSKPQLSNFAVELGIWVPATTTKFMLALTISKTLDK